MTASTIDHTTQTSPHEAAFDLDIRVLEFGDTAPSLISLTDDGCGSSCASPCVTNA
jgi:FxLD family lantipeptide